jgi:nitrogen fixation/metabolism regulation signal transduction histidine kinase
MDPNPYEPPEEAGYDSPEDQNERVKAYFVYTMILLALLMVLALIFVVVLSKL